MQIVIELRHGALSDSYKNQLKEQGIVFKCEQDAEIAEDLGKGLVNNHIHGILTDGQYDKALQRLQKWIIKRVKLVEDNNKII